MKKTVKVAILVMLILTLFAACSSKTTGNDAQDSKPQTKTEENNSEDSKAKEAILADLKKHFSKESYDEIILSSFKDDEEGLENLKLMGIDYDEHCSVVLSLYGIEYGEVTVNGDKAVAKFTMKYFDAEKWEDKLNAEFEAYQSKIDPGSVTEDEVYKELGKIYMNSFKDKDFPVLTQEFSVDYAKNGESWEMLDSEHVADKMDQIINDCFTSKE